LDFTGVSACTRYDVQRGRPMVAALPSLFCWQERGPAVPLRVRAWELRVLRTPQDQPAGAVRLYDFVLDGGLGSPGCSLYLCATPLTAAARKRAQELAG